MLQENVIKMMSNMTKKYGCNKKQCLFRHSMNLDDLVFGNSEQQDYKQGELSCLYIMYKKMYNDNNPVLFDVYAWILYKIGISQSSINN